MFLLNYTRERPSSGHHTSKHESQCPGTFMGLVYSQFGLVKIELKKVNYNYCYIGELINLMSIMDLLQNC